MSDECDFFTAPTDTSVLKNLSQMGEHLKQLKIKMLQAEEAFKQAKQEYEHYSMDVLPMEMFSAGVSELTLTMGGRITCEQKFFCSPNKNEADKNVMAEWLAKHGGEHLIKHKAHVDGAHVEALKDAKIPFAVVDDFNTNSLKAFLKDKLGYNGGIASINLEDIPPAMHFQEVSVVDIQV